MNLVNVVSTLLGGLGLFLVGMWLMTDGLKLAVGDSLRNFLSMWTNTRLRGLAAGASITALVQSSSAVTVATIGFANAGLLNLERAVWVIFGSNVGTTMTGWIVALVGFKLNIDAFALPLIGLGMIIRLTGAKSRRAALGQALVGFGLFFLGISVLKEAFETVGTSINLPGLAEGGTGSFFLYVLLGLLLTTLMQSSSAAIAITLSAAEGGMIPLGAAAATVIGANLGTTSTAILSVIGATPVAKRVAASHVFFNLITAVIALVIIMPMLSLVYWVQGFLNLSPAPASTLALFHTVFNLLGVLLMWPIADRLVRFLGARFITREEIRSRPKYLDHNVLEVPALAVTALLNELKRMNEIVINAIGSLLGSHKEDRKDLKNEREVLEKLAGEFGNFITNMSRNDLPENIAVVLPHMIRIVQQYGNIIDFSCEIAELHQKIRLRTEAKDLLNATMNLENSARNIIDNSNPDMPDFRMEILNDNLEHMEEKYDSLKSDILKEGARGRLDMGAVDELLQQAYLIKDISKRIVKVARRLDEIYHLLGIKTGTISEPLESL